MARNYANLGQQQQEIVDQMQQQQHRRVNTEGPLMQQNSRNAQGGNIHGYSTSGVVSGQHGGSSIGHGNILVDDDDEQQEEFNNNDRQRNHHRRNQARGDIDENGEEEGEDDEFGLDNIDPEEIRQMMSDPRYAALFAAHYGNVQFKRGDADGYGFDEDEDDDQGPHQYIDFNKLPLEQQQYYLQHAEDELLDDEDQLDDDDDGDQGVRGIVGKGNGIGFFAEDDPDLGSYVKFNENAGKLQQKFTYDEEGRMLPEAESDYCEDLAEIYIQNGNNEDVVRYKAIHLMDKGQAFNQVDGNGEKFQCPETGSHFEFLEMVSRLKRLQKLRISVDKMIEDQNQRLIQKEQQRQLLLQQQQQQQLALQQQQLSPQSQQTRSSQQHQRIESIQRSSDLSGSARQQPDNKSQHKRAAPSGAAILPTQEQHILTTETATGAYNVYGSTTNNNRQQRHSSTGVKNQGTSQSKLLLNGNVSQQAANGYLNTQPNHHNNEFDTEMSNQMPANQIISQEEEEEMIRRHQMVLMAPENDEDEIVDLLGSQFQYNGQNNPSISQKNGHGGSILQGSTHSKMSIINQQQSQQQNQQSQQRKPPITGSTQKIKKTQGANQQPSQAVQNSNKLKNIFNVNPQMVVDNQQMCYTEVNNHDPRPTRQQQVAYNNFFKVGPNENTVGNSNIIQANHSRRNQQLDLKTQKELELYALSQQFLEHKGSILASAPSNQRNQGHQQYATHTYFAQNNNPQPIHQLSNPQRSSKRQASAGGASAFMNQGGSTKSGTKKTRTSSTSQAFNTHYGSANAQNNNFASNKFISHQPAPSAVNPQTLNGAPAPPIVMVMNPSKQTQIQNILMNFYQNTNSRANHHQYDHRVYPTKVSNNKNPSSTNTGASLASSKAKNNDAALKMGVAPPSQSAGQYKTYNVINPGNYHPTYPQMIGGAAIDRKHLVTIQKQLQGSKQMMLKKAGTAGANQRNQNNLGVASKTIDNTGMPVQSSLGTVNNNQQQHQIIVQQIQNSVESMDGSRPQSAIKKKSTGISPNSKTNKQTHLVNSGGGQGMARVTSNGKNGGSNGKAYHNSKYDALNPKYIQFKSRDVQHKKTNSYSLGGFSGSMSSYQKSSKAKNLNVIPAGGSILNNHQHVLDTYQIHSTTHSNYQQQQLYSNNHHNHQHGVTFIENSMGSSNMGGGVDNIMMTGGTPSSTSQVTKKSLIIQPIGNQLNIQHHQIYETSPPTQKQKSLVTGSAAMKQLAGSTSGKSRQPNHIISCGGILSTKLASATVQDQVAQSSVNKMDMNAIMKKISGTKKSQAQQQPDILSMGSYSQYNTQQQNQTMMPVTNATFDNQEKNNNRYSTGGGSNSHNNNNVMGHQMSFAGKKITQVPTGGVGALLSSSINQHQIDATKRLSVNLHSGFIGGASSSGQQQQQHAAAGSSKVRHSHSKSKGAGIGGSSTTQSRHASVVPSSHMQHNQLQSQTKSAKRINHQVTSSTAGQINGPLFASSKKSNRFSSGISYDYRSSDRRCDTVQ